MEELKNNNKKGLIIVTILCLLFTALVGYIIYDKTSSNKGNVPTNIESNENTNITENQEETPVTQNENENTANEQFVEKEYEMKNIDVDFNSIKTNNYVGFTWDSLENYTENKYAINLSINNIMTNDKAHSIKISNYKPGDYSCTQGVEKVISFDGKPFYEPYAQGCYLSGLNKIIVLNNKYVVIYIGAESAGWIYVFDENGNEIKTHEETNNKTVRSDMAFFDIDNITDDTITFTGFDSRVHDDMRCKDNKYNLTINNGVLNYTLIEKGTVINQLCL